MKLILKLLVAILLIAVLLVVGVLVNKDKIIRQRAISEVETITGFPLEIEGLEMGLLSSKFVLNGCRLMNPPEEGFEFEEALVIDELSADVKLLSLLTSTIAFRSIVVDVPTLNVETTKDGVNNFELLQQRFKEYADSRPKTDKDSKPSDEPKEEKKSTKDKDLFIESLDIRLGKGQLKDASKGEEATTMELDLQISRHYDDVDNLNDVAVDMTSAVLQKTFMGFVGGELGDILKGMNDDSSDSTDLKQEAEKLEDQFKGLLKQFK